MITTATPSTSSDLTLRDGTPISNLRPLGSNYLVQLLAPPEKSAGGIFLPDNYKSNWTHGKVLAVGPGERVQMLDEPDTEWDFRTSMELMVGDEVIFEPNSFRAFAYKNTVGVVADENVVGMIPGGIGEVIPMNDWVDIRQDPDILSVSPTIIYAEEYRPKPMTGVIRDCGPGEMRRKGLFTGIRKSCAELMGLAEPLIAIDLRGKRVQWDQTVEVLSIGRQSLEQVFIRADDLFAVEAS